ncbi:hypothetical protein CEXT_126981 [Caerostris extrusa]|uniref:Uncharacterized protein n=1 Tax=Caerostris extrusa TaxID=172846 RepID=A0AAV4YBI4_CAEEX|nr:hypothetical protein CEXT_126981 [Caerostris extrusa]
MEKQCHYLPGIEIKLSILPLQVKLWHTRRTCQDSPFCTESGTLLGHNPSVSPLSGLPHIRFDPPLPRSLISIRRGGTSSWLKMNLSFQNHLLFKGGGGDFGRK